MDADPARTSAPADAWPAPPEDWEATRATFHLWTQVVGKIRMAHTPLLNHWWNVPLYVTPRGLTTSLIPFRPGRGFQIDFDLVDHALLICDTEGARRTRALTAEPVADFYAAVMAMLDDLDLSTEIWTMPVEIVDAIPFETDKEHRSYDGEQVHRFWRVLVESNRVLEAFRSRFVGKTSPVHFFWGGLDLAETRFSGRGAPPHPGGVPHCGPQVMIEAYSQEVSSCGYWPGPTGRGQFYCYTYPEPAGFSSAPVSRPAAYDTALGEFVLPYEAVLDAAASGGGDELVLRFLQETYEAAANAAAWDRERLERRWSGVTS